MPRRGLILALGAFFVSLIALTGCGGGLPGDSVAQVGGTNLTVAQFNHWLSIDAHAQAASGGGAVVLPDPPDYKSCIATLRKSAPKIGGKVTSSDAQLRTQCQQQYSSLRDGVMQFLIQAQWVIGEAARQKITVTNAQVQQSFQQTKQQQFPTQAAFNRFLQTSGMTVPDIDYRLRVILLANRIQSKVANGVKPPTQAQISAYYSSHRSAFGQPERRDLLVVLAKSRADANSARAALAAGQSFVAVVKRYSIDPTTKGHGGKLSGVTHGQQDKAFDAAIFGAVQGNLIGPVRSPFGYYVFKVTKIHRASQQSLTQAQSAIRQILLGASQQQALTSFVNSFDRSWKAKTNCRSGYVVAYCKNYKPPAGTVIGPNGLPQQSTTPTPSTQGGTPTTG